jgi:hypothetical protein
MSRRIGDLGVRGRQDGGDLGFKKDPSRLASRIYPSRPSPHRNVAGGDRNRVVALGFGAGFSTNGTKKSRAKVGEKMKKRCRTGTEDCVMSCSGG